jgi:NADH:ubiquinone oxidoreductase subunit 3 (subunit A)
LEKAPHKSGWKTRKRDISDIKKEDDESYMSPELRETLNKIKKYIMIVAILLILPIIVYLLSFISIQFQIALLFIPFTSLVAVFMVVFVIYFPITDALKKTKK